MSAEYAPSRARVVLVYIAEAHAADVWPINSAACHGPANSVRTPTCLAERCATATRMVDALGLGGGGGGNSAGAGAGGALSVVADNMEDGFLRAFAAWPTRLYGIGSDGATIERIAQPQDAAFDLAPMLEWLREAASAEVVPS